MAFATHVLARDDMRLLFPEIAQLLVYPAPSFFQRREHILLRRSGWYRCDYPAVRMNLDKYPAFNNLPWDTLNHDGFITINKTYSIHR
ncbi:hypothetical protein A8C76_25740 [Escherichia coli]|nr:hypothetical protein A8C76_25740 [Escherichia coli]